MKIYEVRTQFDSRGNYAFAALTQMADIELLGVQRFHGQPLSQTWSSLQSLVEFEKTCAPRGNFIPFLDGTLVVDAAGRSQLYPILTTAGELLPLSTFDGNEYTLINLTPAYGCVDTIQSDWDAFPSSGRVKWVSRYEFVRELLPRVSLFKTSFFPAPIFATEGHLSSKLEFKAQVELHALTGLRFREVWNDDGDPIARLELFEDLKR